VRIAIAGAGIGGMTLAALLDQRGHDVVVVEQAATFGEVGAGIQISPNGARVLSRLGLADDLARIGTVPERIVHRRWADDAILLATRQGARPTERYGFAYYNVYRPDLVAVLAAALGGVDVRFGSEVIGARNEDGSAALDLADGTVIEADIVIGADGIHSAVREAAFGVDEPTFSRSIAYRALVPRADVPEQAVEVTNRVGPDRHLVSYFVGENQRFFNPSTGSSSRSIDGRCTTAHRCRRGPRAESACWAMPAIRCCRSWPRAPVRPSRTLPC